MPRIREEGVCTAHSKDGGNWNLPRSEFSRLKQEWMAGAAFFEGRGFYGSTIVLKLGDIVGLGDTTPEQIKDRMDDDAAAKKEDEILGL